MQMICFADEIHAWGHTATVHYTHPPRSVLTQFVLSGRIDFTETPPGDPVFRAAAFFRSFISNGVETDLSAAPLFSPSQFTANGVTEIKGEFIAQNCGARALVTQFQIAPPASPAAFAMQADTRILAYHNTVNGTIRCKHIVKVFAGGRAVSEQEAIRDAEANARRLHLDLSGLTLAARTDASLALAQRVE
jgi:hypothetical protein